MPPPRELMEGMGQLIHEGLKAGVFLGGEGLRASRHRVRLRIQDGRIDLSHGPYKGENELVASVLHIKVRSIDDAVGWAKRVASVIGDCEIEVGPVCEPWHLGVAPPPEGDPPIRFLLLVKAGAASEAGRPLSRVAQEAFSSLKEEMKGEGVLLGAEALEPSSRAVRLRYVNGQRTMMTDGPFAESKELVAGFSILRFNTREQIVEWIGRFARLFPSVEVDVRPLQEPANLE